MTLKRHGLRMLLGAAAILVALAGVAWAANPGAGGLISGCYGQQSRILRVIDAEAGDSCLNSETAISWNQQGPQGDVGPAGPAGPQGDQGPQGPAGISGYEIVTQSVAVPPGTAFSVAASCPAGKRVLGGGFAGYGIDWNQSAPRAAFGWFVNGRNNNAANTATPIVDVYAICATVAA